MVTKTLLGKRPASLQIQSGTMLGKRLAFHPKQSNDCKIPVSQEVVCRPKRMEERSRVQKNSPQSFCLLFESAPVWLLALNPRNAAYIYLLKCDFLGDFNAHLDENKINKILSISALGQSQFVSIPL